MVSLHEQRAIAERVSVRLSNKKAVEGCDRCIDCGTSIEECLSDSQWVGENRVEGGSE